MKTKYGEQSLFFGLISALQNYKNNTFINIFEYIVFPYIVVEAVMAVIVW